MTSDGWAEDRCRRTVVWGNAKKDFEGQNEVRTQNKNMWPVEHVQTVISL